MNYYNKHNIKILKYRFTNKFFYKSIKDIPQLIKITLHIGSTNVNDLQYLSTSLLALNFLTNQKGIITKASKQSLVLQINKGNPTGCKKTINKLEGFKFLMANSTRVLSKIKNFKGFIVEKQKKKNGFSFKIYNIMLFDQLDNQYLYLKGIGTFDTTITANTKKIIEFRFMFYLLAFYFKKDLK